MTTGTKPIARTMTITGEVASLTPKSGASVSSAWTASQATATYTTATRRKLRPLSSEISDRDGMLVQYQA
jgi:hypothetical protein